MADRYVVLGLAPARAAWFHAVGRWASAAALPAEFVRCVSMDELRLRLRSGRRFSAVLLDADQSGLDRDLLRAATDAGVAVVVVDDRRHRDWRELGAAAVLARAFSRDELLEVLAATARPVGDAVVATTEDAPAATDANGVLLAVTGPGGTGASTVAIALAQGVAATIGPTGEAPTVLLADCCRAADQAMLHHSRVLVPSIQEVVEAHRGGAPSPDELRAQTFAVPARGYRLLLGLRRPRLWVTLRPQALRRTLHALTRLADVVVADVDADVEGEAETGSSDVEERHLLARLVLTRADVVVLVLEPSMKGVHAGARVLHELAGLGVPPARVLPVVTRSPRSPRLRAEITRALTELASAALGPDAAPPSPPLHLPARPVDRALRDGVALPAAMAGSLAQAVAVVRARAGAPPAPVAAPPEPARIVPGTLGVLTREEADE